MKDIKVRKKAKATSMNHGAHREKQNKGKSKAKSKTKISHHGKHGDSRGRPNLNLPLAKNAKDAKKYKFNSNHHEEHEDYEEIIIKGTKPVASRFSRDESS